MAFLSWLFERFDEALEWAPDDPFLVDHELAQDWSAEVALAGPVETELAS